MSDIKLFEGKQVRSAKPKLKCCFSNRKLSTNNFKIIKKNKERPIKWLSLFVSFTCLLFLLQACNNNDKPLTQHLQNDTIPPPKVIMIADLPDSLKPIITPLDKAPKATVIPVPKHPGGFYKRSTLSDSAIVQLEPPKVTKLSLLKDDKGNIVKDKDGHSIVQNIRGVSQFTNFTMADGLGLSTITCAKLDHFGNLWFGHDGAGATRYDGKTFTTFTKEQGLSSNYVYGITEDKSGNLLFMTAGDRVSRFDGKRFTLFGKTVPGIFNVYFANVQSIIQDRSGDLWFASGTGVTRFNGKSYKFFTTADGLPNNNVTAICEDMSGKLWFGTYGAGVSCYDGKEFTTFNTAKGYLVDDHINCITLDKSGKLWFGSDVGGVSCYDGKKFTKFTTAQGLVSNSISCITEDRSGKLWFGTFDAGASRYDARLNDSVGQGKSFTSFTRKEGLSSNAIRSITEDNSGSIWFGTYGEGACRYDGDAFTMFSTTQGLADNSIFSVAEDISGSMWFGTPGGGASFFDGKRFTTFTNQQGLGSDFIKAIANDRAGNLWFGTLLGGLTRYDGKTFTQYTTRHGLLDDFVGSVIVDNNQNIWVGTANGISMFDGKAFTSFKLTGVGSEIFQDRSGNIWFGAYKSLVQYNGQSFTYFSKTQGLPDEDIRCIAQDTNGKLWLGTGAGVSRFDGQKFDNLTTADGLADNNVYDIVGDKEGNIYISTNIGITELSADAISLPVSQMREGMRHFTTQQGYPISGPYRNSMYCDSKGIIWIGTATENAPLIRFDPSALPKQDKRPPSPVIQQIKVDEMNICWSDLKPGSKDDSLTQYEDSLLMPANITEENLTFRRSLTQQEREHMRKQFGEIRFDSITPFYFLPLNLQLPHTHNNITIDFNATEVTYPHLVNYQFILEGYNKDWSPVTKSTTATFGNIREGNYTFKVIAQGPNGIWSKPVAYTFKVLPPWWRTWWAYTFYFLIFLVALRVFSKWRERNLRLEKEKLEATVENRTKQLNKSIETLKATQSQLIQSEKMASLGELTAGIAHEIQNPLNFVNNFSEVNKELIDELQQEVKSGNAEEAITISNNIKQNGEKILYHGKRADAIVRGMLQHSRSSSGVKEPTYINTLADEYLRLAYHGFRAKDNSFNATTKTDFDEKIGTINIIPQEIGRVLLNLYNNAFYAVDEKKKLQGKSYEPLLSVSTKKVRDKLSISVKDNGNGIPQKELDKIFQPFFTTKPTGQGTGLGLSLAYDIVKAHGGEIKVNTREGEFTEFVVHLPVSV